MVPEEYVTVGSFIRVVSALSLLCSVFKKAEKKGKGFSSPAAFQLL